MRERIMNDLKEAMKNQDKELLNVIRMIKGAIQLEEINLKKELDDIEMTSLLSKQIKTRKETLEDLEKANREDLIVKTKKEIEILERYIDEVFEEVKPETAKDIGKIMGKISPLLKGKADMSLVSKLIKDRLN